MLGWLSTLKGLTLTNALVIVLLVVAVIPAYFVYRALGDPALLDRFLSNYRELPSNGSNCAIREARLKGGAQTWIISTGFAYAGADRWAVSVVLDHAPSEEEIASYCATLGLIVDKMHVAHDQ